MRVSTTQDNTAAIEFLTTCHPEWIDEMPVIASARSPGKSNITQKGFYDERKRRGVLAYFFGTGCKKGDDGWHLLVVSDATEIEFNAIALRFSGGVMMAVGLPLTAGWQTNGGQ